MKIRSAAVAPAVAMLFSACASGGVRTGPAQDAETPSATRLSIPREAYRPGEAVVVEARSKDGTVPEFWLATEGGDWRRVWPVGADEAAAGAGASGKFVFTDLTETAGRRSLLAKGGAARRDAAPWSAPATFVVEGERRFARDAEGLIERADAERIALAAAGLPADLPCRTRLVAHGSGLRTWEVETGETGPGRRLLVNPYLGVPRTLQP